MIFDLDETLIHCNENSNVRSDIVLPIKFPTGQVIEAGINIRPYTLECMRELANHYEIIVFTASHNCYANVVLDYLDPKKEIFQHRLFREHCIQTEEGLFVKDLRVIENRALENTLIIDNAAYSFGFQLDNGVPILPYYDNKEDRELVSLTQYLKTIKDFKEIREVNRKMFKLREFGAFQDAEDVLQGLYGDLPL